MLGQLAGEYEQLLTRVAVKQEPLALGQELQVGQLSLFKPSAFCETNVLHLARKDFALQTMLAKGSALCIKQALLQLITLFRVCL